MSEVQTVPPRMGSAKCIDDLPDDVLVEVFSYLSFEELVQSVYHVSSRWHSVAQDVHLWRKLEYKPTSEETDNEIVKILRQTRKLQTLNLDNRGVRSPVLYAFMENCSELRKLIFNINQRLSEQLVKSLVQSCKKLEYLAIPDKNVSTLDGAEMIGQLQKLKTLHIVSWGSSSHSVWLRPIGDGCPLLQHLDLVHQGINTADFKHFMQMKRHQLQSIKVIWHYREGGVGKSIIPHLTVCETLKKLTIDCFLNNVEATAGYEALRSMKHITSLSFIEMQYADVNDLVNVFSNKGMCHLIELKFDFYVAYDDRLSETICNNCPLLKVLGFIDCFNMTDRSLENLHKLKNLEYLNLLRFNEMTDSGMDFVCKCKGLKYLNLLGCTGLTERSMNQLIDFKMLQTLILDYCNINGFPLNLIPTLMTKLTLLSINYCEGVNLEDVARLCAEMPRLTVHADQRND